VNLIAYICTLKIGYATSNICKPHTCIAEKNNE